MDKIQKLMVPEDRKFFITKKEAVVIKDQILFNNGEDGRHVWEAGIVLSRFVVLNNQLFQAMSIMEFGSGTGIACVAGMKYAGFGYTIITDYLDYLIEDIGYNVHLNFPQSVNSRYAARNVDWRTPPQDLPIVDAMIASDVVYAGAPYVDLANLIHDHLSPQGSFYMVMPEKRHCENDFLTTMEELGFSVRKLLLKDEQYYASPLEDEALGKQYFGLFQEQKFYVYIFSKNSDITQEDFEATLNL